MSKRLKAMGVEKYQNGKHGFDITLHPGSLKIPYSWSKPRIVFVNSMSDLFHKDVPLSFIQDVFRVMEECRMHTFQVLTKRADRLLEVSDQLPWPKNIWMGVSVEDHRVTDRIDLLRQTGAHIKFLSCEPLIGPLPNLDLTGIEWVIVGGESGRKPRPMKASWVVDIRDQCERAGVDFFFKQWGGTNKKKAGRVLEGRTYDYMPAVAT